MNRVLDQYADNPVIDEVVYWPPREIAQIVARRVGSNSVTLEVRFESGESHTTTFDGERTKLFPLWWSEALVVLRVMTNIELRDEAELEYECSNGARLTSEVQRRRDETIAEMMQHFGDTKDPQQCSTFLEQFGPNSIDLPDAVQEQMSHAMEVLNRC